MDEIEPKPCPFCGHTGHVIDETLRDGYEGYEADPDAYAYNVRCIGCAATGGWQKSKSGARMFWNMRAGERELHAEVERLRAELVPVPFSQRYPDDGQLILIWDAYFEKWQMGAPWKSANDGTDDTYLKMHYPFWFPVPPAPPHGA